jgi:hypothetical protein
MTDLHQQEINEAVAAALDDWWRRVESDFLHGQPSGKPIGVLSPGDINDSWLFSRPVIETDADESLNKAMEELLAQGDATLVERASAAP